MKNGKKKFLAGTALGAFLGGIAGLLFAPKSGEETRKDLKKAANKTAKATKESVGEAREIVEDSAAKAKKAAGIVKEETQKSGSGLVRNVRRRLKSIR